MATYHFCSDCFEEFNRDDYLHERCHNCKKYICSECLKSKLKEDKIKNKETWKSFVSINSDNGFNGFDDNQLDHYEDLIEEFLSNVLCSGCQSKKKSKSKRLIIKKNVKKCKQNK